MYIATTDLEISGEREILPERVPLETVVGEDSSEVRVAGEVDAKHVEDLPLIPEIYRHIQSIAIDLPCTR